MKSIIIPAVAALGLAAGAPAWAAPDHAATQLAQRDKNQDKNQDKNRNRNRDQKQDTNRDRKPDTNRDRSRERVNQPAPAPSHGVTRRTAPAPKVAPKRTPPRTMKQEKTRRFDWNSYQQGRTPPRARNVPRLDFHNWHRNFKAPKHFHRAPYHRPSGWYYRRWLFGMVLPTFFWTRDYWIADYWMYDLPDPPYGYVWVRYGDDALLVNVRSGYVLQAEYDLFD